MKRLLLMAALAGTVLAEEPGVAKYREGVRAYQEGRFETALRAFGDAARISVDNNSSTPPATQSPFTAATMGLV